MKKKSTVLINLSKKLLELAPTMAGGNTACLGLVGEPKLPKRLETK